MKEPLQQLDSRTNAFRPDLADAALQAFVKAKRYVAPEMRHCIKGLVPLWEAPCAGAARLSEIRSGEFLDVFEERNGYAWVQNRYDRCVGYIETKDALSDEIADLSNRVTALGTFVYQKPDRKSAVLDRLTLGSYVQARGTEGDFLALATGGYVFAGHIADTNEAICPDYVFTAGRLLHAPFLVGGRSPLGIDAGGLVQIALEMAGIDAPRAPDQQRALFGQALAAHWRDVIWRRGDLVFFADHAGIMVDHACMIHAHPHTMQVTVDPLDSIVGMNHEIIAAGRPF